MQRFSGQCMIGIAVARCATHPRCDRFSSWYSV